MNTLLERAEIQLLDQLDEALENKKVREISWPMMAVAKGQTCWIPYGTLALVCGADEVASFTVIPWVNSTMYGAAKQRGEATEFLADALCKYLKKNDDKPGLKQLCPAVSRFLDANR